MSKMRVIQVTKKGGPFELVEREPRQGRSSGEGAGVRSLSQRQHRQGGPVAFGALSDRAWSRDRGRH